MDISALPDLQTNVGIFVESLKTVVPVAIGLAAFVGLAILVSFTFVRGH